MDPGGNGPASDYRRYAGLGLVLPMPILAGTLAGYWVDGRFGTGPWLTVLGAGLGMFVGFTAFITTILRLEKRGANKKPDAKK